MVWPHIKILGHDEDNSAGDSWLVVLRLNVPVNNFSVMSGRNRGQ